MGSHYELGDGRLIGRNFSFDRGGACGCRRMFSLVLCRRNRCRVFGWPYFQYNVTEEFLRSLSGVSRTVVSRIMSRTHMIAVASDGSELNLHGAAKRGLWR